MDDAEQQLEMEEPGMANLVPKYFGDGGGAATVAFESYYVKVVKLRKR